MAVLFRTGKGRSGIAGAGGGGGFLLRWRIGKRVGDLERRKGEKKGRGERGLYF